MTVSSTTRKAGPFAGNGVTTLFPFGFKVFAKSDIQVIRATAAGAETILVLDSDYLVLLNPDQTANPGGTIQYPVTGSALPLTFALVAVGAVPYTQGTSLPTGGAFNAANVEAALDRLTILTQQLKEETGRSAKISLTSTADAASLVRDISNLVYNLASIQTVSGAITAVNSVAANATNINTLAGAIASVNTLAAVSVALSTVAANIAAVNVNANNVVAIQTIAINITAIQNAQLNALASEASAVRAAASAAAVNLPNLTGAALRFLRVKTDETGYELVSSVAAPAFYGFNLSTDTLSLTLDYGRGNYNANDFATFTMSENVTFEVAENNLRMVL